MSKQVELKDGGLYIHTRENYENANKIILVCKGKKAKAFYPYIPQFINDLESVKNMSICGFRVDVLTRFALNLRGKNIDTLNLHDCNVFYTLGYDQALTDINKQLNENIEHTINSIYNEHHKG